MLKGKKVKAVQILLLKLRLRINNTYLCVLSMFFFFLDSSLLESMTWITKFTTIAPFSFRCGDILERGIWDWLQDQGQMRWGTKQKWEKLDKMTSQSALLTVSVCLARMCKWWRVDRMHVNHLRSLWSWTSWQWTRTRSCSGRRRPVGSSLRKMLKRRRTAGGSLTSLRCLSAVCWNSEGPSPTVKRETECVCVSCMPESLSSGS